MEQQHQSRTQMNYSTAAACMQAGSISDVGQVGASFVSILDEDEK